MEQPTIHLPDNPHWDFAGALARVNNDEQLLREIVGIFLERMNVMLANIGSALREQDAEKLHMSSHTLKGSAGNMLANPAMAFADRFEQLAQAGDFSSTGPLWEALQQEADSLQQLMMNWLEADADSTASRQG